MPDIVKIYFPKLLKWENNVELRMLFNPVLAWGGINKTTGDFQVSGKSLEMVFNQQLLKKNG